MNALRLSILAVCLVGSAAFANGRHSHHTSGGSASSPPVCLRWAYLPADAGTDAGEVTGDEMDGPEDGGAEADAGAEEADAGTAKLVRVCVERAPVLGCSSTGSLGGGMLALIAVLLSRRRRP